MCAGSNRARNTSELISMTPTLAHEFCASHIVLLRVLLPNMQQGRLTDSDNYGRLGAKFHLWPPGGRWNVPVWPTPQPVFNDPTPFKLATVCWTIVP
jgi:hypothetical protein